MAFAIEDSDVLRVGHDGVLLRVRLTPKAGHNRIDGIYEGAGQAALAARVTAPPEKGKANRALIRLMAKTCGVAAGRISIVSGETARLKELNIEADAAQISGALADFLERSG